MDKIIMAWSECGIEIGKTPEDESMAKTLKSVGTIKDKSSTLEPSDGDTLEAKKTGGKTVAKETQEGGFVLSTRVIEPTNELLTELGLGAASEEDDFNVKTHLVADPYSVKVTPKNKGAIGIKAPKTNVTYKPGWSEEEGNYADIEFEIVQGATDVWYTRFKSKGLKDGVAVVAADTQGQAVATAAKTAAK